MLAREEMGLEVEQVTMALAELLHPSDAFCICEGWWEAEWQPTHRTKDAHVTAALQEQMLQTPRLSNVAIFWLTVHWESLSSQAPHIALVPHPSVQLSSKSACPSCLHLGMWAALWVAAVCQGVRRRRRLLWLLRLLISVVKDISSVLLRSAGDIHC